MKNINLDILILFDNIRIDPIVSEAVRLFAQLDDIKETADLRAYESTYFNLQRQLFQKTQEPKIEGTYWENYICELISKSENLFSLMAEKGDKKENISQMAKREIKLLKLIFSLKWPEMDRLLSNDCDGICGMKLEPNNEFVNYRQKIADALTLNSDEESTVQIWNYYHENCCGIFEEYRAFLYEDRFVGVKKYDGITFENLIGYDTQKKAIIENTEYFLKNYKANNALLHGDRGTGKSSCVKALLNRFEEEKLRLISLNKNNLEQINTIIEAVADRGCKFIIFIDDLSFEENEVSYKYFKSVIDGGIEAQPSNVLIYVTSNRRNLIKETWKDRGENGEVHSNDGMQERLSLADRFGLSITFTSPARDEFLNIVKGISINENLGIDEKRLIEEAMVWDVRQKGRSGRSARQFINYLYAKVQNEKGNIC